MVTQTDGRPLRQLITAEQIAARVAELGEMITRDYRDAGKDLVLVCVLKGSVIFLADLCRQIALPLSMDFIGIASYGDETKSSGVVKITNDLSKPMSSTLAMRSERLQKMRRARATSMSRLTSPSKAAICPWMSCRVATTTDQYNTAGGT